MKVFQRIIGAILLLSGLAWIFYMMAGVIAQTKGFTSIGELIIPLAFHALSMFFGMMFYAMGTQNKNMLVADK